MLKYLLFIFCALFILPHNSQCQDARAIDSLRAVLQTQKGADRFPTLYELVFQFIEKDNRQALALVEEAETAALLSGDSLSIVKAKRVEGQILLLLEKTSEAVDLFMEALPVAERRDYTMEEYFIESNLARVEIFTGAYDKALKRYDKILTLANGLDRKQEVASTLNKIGLTYYKLKDYRKALFYYRRALDEGRPVDTMPFSFITANIGLCYAHLGDFVNATRYAEASRNRCMPACGDALRGIEYTFGVISLGEKRFYDAERHLLKSLELARDADDSRFQLDNIYLLSDLYMERKWFRKAEQILLEAEYLIDRGTPFNLEKIKIYSRFSQLYLAIHQYKRASHYQSKYIVLKDSVYNEELTGNLMRAEANFAERENMAKLAAQEKVIVLDQEVIRGQRRLNVLSGAVAILLVSLLIFLHKGYREKKAMNCMLDRKVMERTRDLEASQHQLMTGMKQQRLTLVRAAADMREKINAVKGLCLIARAEISDPVAQSYVDSIDRTSMEVEAYLKGMLEEQKASVSGDHMDRENMKVNKRRYNSR